MSQQISWTLYLTKTQALCSGLDANPSYHLTHIQKYNNHRNLLAHRNVSHLLFTGLQQPGRIRKCTDPPTVAAADKRPVHWAVGWFFLFCFFVRHSALRLNRLSDCAAEPRGAVLPRRRTKTDQGCVVISQAAGEVGQVHNKQDRADSDVNFSAGVWTRFERDDEDPSTPPQNCFATWLCLVGSGAKR